MLDGVIVCAYLSFMPQRSGADGREKMSNAIKFMKHYVTDGVTRARVFYSLGHVYVKQADGTRVLSECVSLYAKDYGATLSKIEGLASSNDSDYQSDYVVQDVAHIFPESPMYAAALSRVKVAA
jgi:hypothetical protein